MRIPSSKYIRIVLIALAVALLLGLMIVHQFSQDETLIISKPSDALAIADAKQGTSVQKEVDPLKSVSAAREDEHPQPRFANAEQLCNNFHVKPSGKLDSFEFFDALQDHIHGTDHALEDWLRVVASSGSPRQKGAALSLLVAMTDRAIRREVVARTPNCDEVKECSGQLGELVRSKTSPFAHALVNSAIHVSDPKLYGMAHHICQSTNFTHDAVCARIGATHWLQRDPDNGAAALYALETMKLPSSGEDATAFENALHRLSLAKSFDFYLDVASELPPLPSALDDYQHQTQLESTLYYFQVISPFRPNRNITSACAGDYLKNPNRRFTCEAIAKQYLREDASLFDRAILLKLAANLGWDKTKLREITDDFEAVRVYLNETFRREALQIQDASGQVKACHLNLKRFADARKSMSSGEFKQYQREVSEFDIPRERLIEMGRRKSERR